jgi:hypothetical protein
VQNWWISVHLCLKQILQISWGCTENSLHTKSRHLVVRLYCGRTIYRWTTFPWQQRTRTPRVYDGNVGYSSCIADSVVEKVRILFRLWFKSLSNRRSKHRNLKNTRFKTSSGSCTHGRYADAWFYREVFKVWPSRTFDCTLSSLASLYCWSVEVCKAPWAVQAIASKLFF